MATKSSILQPDKEVAGRRRGTKLRGDGSEPGASGREGGTLCFSGEETPYMATG